MGLSPAWVSNIAFMVQCRIWQLIFLAVSGEQRLSPFKKHFMVLIIGQLALIMQPSLLSLPPRFCQNNCAGHTDIK